MITRDQITVPDFYQGYLKAAKEQELLPALRNNRKKFLKFLGEIPKERRDYAYAEGKWTLRELLQHMIDTERVFSFRALWFARQDPSPLPGFDENNWAKTINQDKRRWKDLREEFEIVRRSTICLFDSFSEEQLLRTGISNNNMMSVAAFGFVSAGHVEHHIKVIRERYLKIRLEEVL